MTDTQYSIGASEVAAILGLSPWVTPSQVWARKKGLLTADEGNAATARGHLLERALLWDVADREKVRYHHWFDPAIGDYAAQDDGLYQGPPYDANGLNALRSAAAPWATCRPDAWLVQGGVVRLVEAKTTRGWRDWEAEDGRPILPPWYYVQVQWQMLVTGASETLVEAFCAMDDSRRSIVVRRSENIGPQLLAKVGAWREAHLVGDELPENMPSEITGLVYPRPREPEVWLDPTQETSALVAEYASATEEIGRLETIRKAAKDKLCAVIGDATGIDGLCSWRGTKRGRTFRLAKGGDEA